MGCAPQQEAGNGRSISKGVNTLLGQTEAPTQAWHSKLPARVAVALSRVNQAWCHQVTNHEVRDAGALVKLTFRVAAWVTMPGIMTSWET